MAITLYGVDPSITEAKWSKLFNYVTKQYVTGLQVAPTGTARQVSIGAGDAVAAGVLVESTTTLTVTLGANSTANSRIDTIALQINWSGSQTTGGSIVGVAGAASTTPTPPTLTQTPGTLWQIPLAYVTVAPGATVLPDTAVVRATPGERVSSVYRGSTAFDEMQNGVTTPRVIGTEVIPAVGWPYRLTINAHVQFFYSDEASYAELDATIDGTATRPARTPRWNYGPAVLHHTSNIINGTSSTVRFRMLPRLLETGTLRSAEGYYTIEVNPA